MPQVARGVAIPAPDPTDVVREKIIGLHKELYGAGATYENVVIVLGYGAFFAIWAATAPHLPRVAVLVAGALIGTSVLLYVVFQIAQLTWRILATARFAPVIRSGAVGDDFLRLYRAVEVDVERQGQLFMLAWPFIFLPSLITGVSAALMIIGSAFWGVVGSAQH